MKKISKLLKFLGLGLASLIAFGCSDVDEDSSVSSDVSRTSAKEYSVSFATPSGTNLSLDELGISSNTSVSRTIKGDFVGSEDGSSNPTLDFYMWGKTPDKSTVTTGYSKVTFTSTDTTNHATGKVSIDFAPASYNLTLVALPAGTAVSTTDVESNYISKATYIGYANADLRTGDTIKFYISADGLTGNGILDLTLKPVDTWDSKVLTTTGFASGYSMFVEIQNRQTGAVVATSSGTGAILSLGTGFKNSDPAVSGSAPGSASLTSATGANLPAGTYDFVVCIQDANVTPAMTYRWYEEIIILPNQTLTATVGVPFFVDVAPDAPDYLVASYYAYESTTTENYGIQFNFGYEPITTAGATVTPNTHKTPGLTQSYELEVVDVGNYSGTGALDPNTSATPTSDTDWTGLSNIKNYKKDIYGKSGDGWIAGGLSKNSGGIVIKATLGHEYWARIRAVNSSNTSTWTYFKIWESSPATAYALGENNTFTDYSLGGTGKVYTGKEFKAYALTTAEAMDTTKTTQINPATFAAASVPKSINLMRVKYNLNGGTLSGNWDGSGTASTKTGEVVQYCSLVSSGAIPILSPTAGADALNFAGEKGMTSDIPALVNGAQNWFCWKQDSASGPTLGTLIGHTQDTTPYYYVYPTSQEKLFSSSLVLFASYSSQADVEIYNHAIYDFADGEISVSGTTVTSSTGVVSKNNTVTVSTTSGVTFTYAKAAAASSSAEHAASTWDYTAKKIKIVSNSGKTELEQPFTNNNVNISSALPQGTYSVHIIGIYNNQEYEYSFVIKVSD